MDDAGELRESLQHVAAVNRWLGGERALRRHLTRYRSTGQTLRLLDVGTGNGVSLMRLVAWGRRGASAWRGVGVDIRTATLGVARYEGQKRDASDVSLVAANALALPFPERLFDVTLCTLTLHHFDDLGAAALVREMARVTRELVLVNDLQRGAPAYISARIFAATWWRGNRLTRNDGPLSVLRSFSAPELLDIGERAGLEAPRVHKHFPFRLVLTGRP